MACKNEKNEKSEKNCKSPGSCKPSPKKSPKK